jgi:hypothetical protein
VALVEPSDALLDSQHPWLRLCEMTMRLLIGMYEIGEVETGILGGFGDRTVRNTDPNPDHGRRFWFEFEQPLSESELYNKAQTQSEQEKTGANQTFYACNIFVTYFPQFSFPLFAF